MSIDHLRPYLRLDGICSDPIFVIGSPRSGTTALGEALGKHPDLWASKESYVLHQLYGQGRAERVWSHHWERTNPNWLRAEEVDRAEFLAFLGLGMNALYSSRSGGLRWIDATPLNTSMVDEIAAMFPGAYFVHIIRDGRLVVRSMGGFLRMLERLWGSVPAAEVPDWMSDFSSRCETWAGYVSTALEFERSTPDRCVAVRNEDLLADPRAALAPILDFIGASANDGPADYLAASRINSSFRGEDPELQDEVIDWPEEQRRTFAEVAGPVMIAAGYLTEAELEGWIESVG